MHGESTTSRASALWADQFALGKTRSLKDRLDEIDAVTLENVNNWLKNRDYGDITMVYIGPDDLQLDDTILLLK
jgi:predicted Zn-dependent peptidase